MLVVGLAVTALLVVTCLELYRHNESRLLGLRARELGLVLTATVPTIQTPLASAAELADATNGNARRFRAFIAPYVGQGRQFASVSLWPLDSPRLAPTATVGVTPVLYSMPEQANRFYARAKSTDLLNVTGILGTVHPSLGYEYSIPSVRRRFAVFAENRLPADRRSTLESNPAFSELDYALYLGRTPNTGQVLVTSLRKLPVTGSQATTVVPFGDSSFTLVVTPKGSLGGIFFERLPWIVGILGVLITLAAAVLTDRLTRGRQRAEELADVLDRVAAENQRMYTEQRGIAQTLQHALLPDALPELSGLGTSARYIPAASGIDVGGDWYDVVAVDDRHVLLLIGDVSGHGLRAATTMASLRHATLAYAAEDSRPASILAKLSALIGAGIHDYFATVLCALIDIGGHTITLASAGHLPPLLVSGHESRFVEVEPGTPIGVGREPQYRETSLSVPANATLVAFTDGLVERRGEVLDTGLERLRTIASKGLSTLEELMDALERDLALEDHHDDTAIVAIRWQN